MVDGASPSADGLNWILMKFEDYMDWILLNLRNMSRSSNLVNCGLVGKLLLCVGLGRVIGWWREWSWIRVAPSGYMRTGLWCDEPSLTCNHTPGLWAMAWLNNLLCVSYQNTMGLTIVIIIIVLLSISWGHWRALKGLLWIGTCLHNGVNHGSSAYDSLPWCWSSVVW